MTDNPPNGFDKIGMFRLIADKIERNPALLQIALDNIARWIAKARTSSTGSASGRS